MPEGWTHRSLLLLLPAPAPLELEAPLADSLCPCTETGRLAASLCCLMKDSFCVAGGRGGGAKRWGGGVWRAPPAAQQPPWHDAATTGARAGSTNGTYLSDTRWWRHHAAKVERLLLICGAWGVGRMRVRGGPDACCAPTCVQTAAGARRAPARTQGHACTHACIPACTAARVLVAGPPPPGARSPILAARGHLSASCCLQLHSHLACWCAAGAARRWQGLRVLGIKLQCGDPAGAHDLNASLQLDSAQGHLGWHPRMSARSSRVHTRTSALPKTADTTATPAAPAPIGLPALDSCRPPMATTGVGEAASQIAARPSSPITPLSLVLEAYTVSSSAGARGG